MNNPSKKELGPRIFKCFLRQKIYPLYIHTLEVKKTLGKRLPLRARVRVRGFSYQKWWLFLILRVMMSHFCLRGSLKDSNLPKSQTQFEAWFRLVKNWNNCINMFYRQVVVSYLKFAFLIKFVKLNAFMRVLWRKEFKNLLIL